MRALSIRQPFAELILRGVKTVEYRSRPTRIVGERFHIYASKGRWNSLSLPGPLTPRLSRRESGIIADNIVVPTERLPAWLIELAEQAGMIEPGASLPTGVIVGSAVIERCEEIARERRSDGATQERQSASSSFPSSLRCPAAASLYAWHLADVQRAKRLRKPRVHPQPVWFKPF
jgi:hypothetical protein